MIIWPQDKRRIFIHTPSALQHAVKNKWAYKLGRDEFVADKIIITGADLITKGDTYKAVRRFRDDMTMLLKVNGNNYKRTRWDINENNFTEQDAEAELTLNRWVAGEVLKQALSCHE